MSLVIEGRRGIRLPKREETSKEGSCAVTEDEA